jgi:hypothetical protein
MKQPKLELLDRELIERILTEAFELMLEPGIKVHPITGEDCHRRRLWYSILRNRGCRGKYAN